MAAWNLPEAMVDAALQYTFIEEQLSKFESRLDKIHSEVSTNSKAISKLKSDLRNLTTRVAQAEETMTTYGL